MASRDTALFNAPKTSHFGLLISDDEETSGAEAPAAREQAAETTAGPTGSSVVNGSAKAGEKAAPSTANDRPALSTEEDTGDWACAKVKTHHRRQPPAASGGGGRNVGLARGTSTGTGASSHQSAHGHHGHAHVHQGPRRAVAPVSLDQLNAEQTLEICAFPEVWRTSDIRRVFSSFEGQYRLKWQNDTSCFVHFEGAETAAKALAEVHPESATIRPYAPENVLPASPRPEAGQMSAENTLEIYSFPPTWHSAELNKLLAAFAGHYRLKWRNDAACYVVFDSAEAMQKAQAEISGDPICKVRHYASLSADQGHDHQRS